MGARIVFHHSNFFSLTSPNASSCAGDAKTYYDPMAVVLPTAPSGGTAGYGLAGSTTLPGITGLTGPTGAAPFPISALSSPTETVRPSFIKNVSVDLTDTNASTPSNLASSCSLGRGASVPPTSSCATFDFGAIGGISTTMGGTLLVIGGIQGYNWAGQLPGGTGYNDFDFYGPTVSCGPVKPTSGPGAITAPTGFNECPSSVFALGVNSLPESAFASSPDLMPAYIGTTGPSGPVSTWANISGVVGYSGPEGTAGASAVYSAGSESILLFGGAAPLAAVGATGPGQTVFDTWVFDLKTQTWNLKSSNIFVANKILNLNDVALDIRSAGTAPCTTASASPCDTSAHVAPFPQIIPHSVGSRALFGYLAVPGMALKTDQVPSTGLMDNANIDTTDRLIIVGGLGGDAGVLSDTHRFNPTYGPEVMDALNRDGDALGTPARVTGDAIQVGTSAANGLDLSFGQPVQNTTATQFALQWISSFHTTTLSNSYGLSFTPTSATTTPVQGSQYYTRRSSHFRPDLPPLTNGPLGGNLAVNTAFAPAVNTTVATGVPGTGYVVAAGGFDAASVGSTGVTGVPLSQAVCSTDNTIVNDGVEVLGTGEGSIGCGGGLSLMSRFYNAGTQTDHENRTSQWSMVTNFIDTFSTPNTPLLWTQLREIPTIAMESGVPRRDTWVPWVGGAHLLPGFDMKRNEVAFFGGLDCKNYVDDAFAPCRGYKSPGRYWRLSTNPADRFVPGDGVTTAAVGDPVTMVPDSEVRAADWNGTGCSPNAITGICTSPATQRMPTHAGMATARGLDPAGNVIIVAWGGAQSAQTTEGQNRVYYLYNAGLAYPAVNPTWAYADPVNQTVTGSPSPPSELINAQMVYSHVTGKYYVYGGLDRSTGTTRGDTWELTITGGGATGCQGQTTNPCYFGWKLLNGPGGLTCYPQSRCTAVSGVTAGPPFRRSHRMTEVNYDNQNPGGVDGDATGGVVTAANLRLLGGEQACTATSPCSYGIFMEGGTPDGIHFVGDRWMFDPTANGGGGHWQYMGEFPPRRLAAMAAVDYFVPALSRTVHRSIMFGGETGFQAPQMATAKDFVTDSSGATQKYFVAPTLGDTWMYDHDNNTWNRVRLLGKGYDAPAGTTDDTIKNLSPESEVRQAYNALNPENRTTVADPATARTSSYSELTPPPLAGAMMITRTFKTDPITGGLKALKLPEVYLIGGRLKNGDFMPLNRIYKFCAGSTGDAFTAQNTGPSILSTTNFNCDAFDDSLDSTSTADDPVYVNASSTSPVTDYVGRWMRKTPNPVSPDTSFPAGLDNATNFSTGRVGSFMGAAAYDPTRDRILVFGGLTSNLAGSLSKVTDQSALLTGATVYEYTPPSPVAPTTVLSNAQRLALREGSWRSIPSCSPFTAPVGRYGHSLAFDTNQQGLVMVGGYDAFGNPLTTTVSYPGGRTYTTPEVWTGTYYADNVSAARNAIDPNVAITNGPCFYWKKITLFGNSIDIPSQSPPQVSIAHAASVYIPASGFNTGYYSMFDNFCEKAGPINSGDLNINKLLAGGAYIDIDRSQLGANENLLLNLTYIPLGTNNRRPDLQFVPANESAVFKVHLMRSGQVTDLLRQVLQPRYMAYTASDQFPQIAQSISVLAPPSGQITTEQILVPLSIDPTIDRIRIERYSGTGILLDASIYRMGNE